MIRLVLIAAAAGALAAACASGGSEGGPPVSSSEAPSGAASEVPTLARPLVRRFFEVVDGDTGKPVAGALVRVGGRVAVSDAAGQAVLVGSGAGAFRVRVTAPGYVPGGERASGSSPATAQISIYRCDLQWPMYGATAARTQAHPAIKLRPPFRVVWQRRFGGLLEFPAVVWEGTGYVNTIRGYLTAFSMSTGRRIWRAKIGRRVAAAPAVDEKRKTLVTVSMIPGKVVVVDMLTGRVKWRYPIGRSEPSPLIRGRIAYLAGTNGRVYALDLVRRRLRWSRSLGAKITSSIALRGRRIYLGDYAGRVFALNAANGRVIWQGSAGTRVYGTVAVAGGRVFAPSVFSGLSALSASSGRLLWRIPVGAYLYSSPAVYRSRVYFGDYTGRVYCVRAVSGRILWSRDIGRRVSGAVEVVDRVVYASTFGRTMGWDWRTGRRLWSFPRGEYVPISGNGSTLLVHGHSRIWAVEPKRAR